MKDHDPYNGWKFKLHILRVLCVLISTELPEIISVNIFKGNRAY